MAHGYRTLQHWNQWLAQHFLGSYLLQSEQLLLSELLNNRYGKHVLLAGVSHQYSLLKSIPIPCHTLLSPLPDKDKIPNYIEGDFHEMPILTGSIDLVILPHTLELADNPRQILAEACRMIKPEGMIAIFGFNPYSTWGIRKMLTKHHSTPWSGNFIHSQKVKSWLKLADFEMEKQKSILFRPPVNNPVIYNKLNCLERIGSKCFPLFGGVYMLAARAKVTPLTPIRLKWKQQLSGIQISTSIPGHIARQIKHHK